MKTNETSQATLKRFDKAAAITEVVQLLQNKG